MARTLLEYAEGDELVTLVGHGGDENATRINAQLIEQFHSIPQDAPHDGLFMLNRCFGTLFIKAAADQQAGIESIYARSASLAKRLLADQREVRVLNGDIHHRNIRKSTCGWLAFDPKVGVGEPTYDYANTLCNPPIPELVQNETRLLTNAAILADTLAIDLSGVQAFTYASVWMKSRKRSYSGISKSLRSLNRMFKLCFLDPYPIRYPVQDISNTAQAARMRSFHPMQLLFFMSVLF